MAYSGTRTDQSYAEPPGLWSEARQPGARRKKLAGYLKTANEIRQSYFNQEGRRETHSVEDGPGAFPDAAVVRSGNEEMILFPSYAKHHVKSKRQDVANSGREIPEEEYWRREWDRNEDVNAIVDVDVRGWIYTPAKGQHTRKQRMMIGLARQLSGIPAPAASVRPGDNGYASQVPSQTSSPTRRQDEDRITQASERIIRNEQYGERYAQREAFSEQPSKGPDHDSFYENAAERGRPKSLHATSISSQDPEHGGTISSNRLQSSSQHGKMTSAELAVANSHLLARLKPFMANPLANSPISAFFFNEKESRQQTVYTDASGHFSFRAMLDFVPTHARILASEKLSIVEEILIIPPEGVSLISDIDDTVKHSAIGAGAREIFRNAFIKDLPDLTIEGVREWYSTMSEMSVQIHYVSNSPWQMYPVLTRFFKLAGLPKGSFHLKQYSGMLQGIFEPAAERKKGSLEKIMRDFPQRSFVLIGDSGEADLEVYSEVALANPGRVLGIFIRDVTTSAKTLGYFDSNSSPGSSNGSHNHSRQMSRDSLSRSKRLTRPQDIHDDEAEFKAALAASLAEMEEETRRARRSINPDTMPDCHLHPDHGVGASASCFSARPRVYRNISGTSLVTSPEEYLIDLSDHTLNKPKLEQPKRIYQHPSPPFGELPTKPQSVRSPPLPPKPAGLRIPAHDSHDGDGARDPRKTPPPRPRKPSSAVQGSNIHNVHKWQPSPLSQVQRQESTKKPAPALPERRKVKDTFSRALQMPGAYWQSSSGDPRRDTATLSRPSTKTANNFEESTAPSSMLNFPLAPPPRRAGTTNLDAYSSSPRHRESIRLSGTWPDDESLSVSPGDGMSKKEYLWQQRWQRAKSVLERNGVTLRSWRTGADVADVCVKLVEQELRKIELEARTNGGGTKRALERDQRS